MIILGSSFDDVIDGSADPDEIFGLEGDDRLYGHGGDDSLYGGDGDDMLAGGAGDDLLDGGAGNDTLWGALGADVIAFRDGYGNDVIMDFDLAEDTVWLVSSGVEYWEDVQAHLFDDVDGFAILVLDDGSTLKFEGVLVSQLEQHHFNLPSAPVCFAEGTRITTARGEVAVEDLRPGDLALTLDAGWQPVLWIGRRRTAFGHLSHRHRPVRIAAGAMGHGLPHSDLRVSPQHRLLVQGPDGRRFDQGALAKAKGLCGRPGIFAEVACTSVVYFQILLPRHGLLIANGLPAESFLPRAYAMASLDPAAHAALIDLFPALASDPDGAYGPPVRPILSMKLVANLPASALQTPARAPERLRA